MVLEEAGVQEQVVQLDAVQPPVTPRLVLRLDLLADPRHLRLADRRVRAECLGQAASTSLADSPRTNPAMTRASSALVLVTPVPNRAEANFSVVPRSFGRCNVTGPDVVFTVTGQ